MFGREQQRRFWTGLNYTSVNEDWRTEAAALEALPPGPTLCVTGSGDRPLDLLAAGHQRIVSVDRNPAQNHLLRLKIAALRALPYEAYVSFLGLVQADPRWRRERWLELRDDLGGDAVAFWDARRKAIERGVLYQGRWERFYRRLSAGLRRLRPGLIESLFEFDDLESQRRFVQKRWNTVFWRGLCGIVCAPLFSRLFLGDPAYYRCADVSPGTYLAERMQGCLERFLAREDFMVSLVLRGELSRFDLPPYLTAAGVASVRDRAENIEVETGDVVDLLEKSLESSFAAFSLSDVASFLDPPRFERLLLAVSRSGRRGARFCIRQFLTRHPWPEAASRALPRDRMLELRLASEDRSFVYDFAVGEVSRG